MDEPHRSCWSVRWADFGFESDQPLSINKPQCGVNVVLYSIFRSVVFIYFTTYFIYDLVTTINGFDGVRTFIFLTTWVYVLFNLYVTLAFVNTIIDVFRFFQHPGDVYLDSTPIRYKLQWFMFNITLNGSVVITFAFWIIYYSNPLLRIYFVNMVRNVNLHLLPAVFTLLDLIITAVPVRFVHVIYPLLVGFVYVLFAVVYWRAGGVNPWGMPFIYPWLDFDEDPRGAWVFVIVMIASTLVVQAIVKGFYILREWVVRKVNPSSYSSYDGTSMEHRRLTETTIELTNREAH